MFILMFMNIYITKENEKHLRTRKPSMSGYINGLIEMERGIAPHIKPAIKITHAFNKPQEKPLIIKTKEDAEKILVSEIDINNEHDHSHEHIEKPKSEPITYKPTNNWGA